MKLKNSDNLLMKELSIKNQQRCLNSQPFSRQRAYLTKQKREKRIITLQTHQDQFVDKHQVNRDILNGQSDQFQSGQPSQLNINDLNSRLDKVHQIIHRLQQQSQKNGQSKSIQKQSSRRLKTGISCQQKTRPDTITTANIQSQNNADQVEIDRPRFRFKSEQFKQVSHPIYKNQSVTGPAQNVRNNQMSYSSRSVSKKMVKIKSNRNMLKVYNPFPIPFAEIM